MEEEVRQPWRWWREEKWWRDATSNAGGGLILAIILRPDLWVWVVATAATGLIAIGTWTLIKRLRIARAERAAIRTARAERTAQRGARNAEIVREGRATRAAQRSTPSARRSVPPLPPRRLPVRQETRAFRRPALYLAAAMSGAVMVNVVAATEQPSDDDRPSIEENVPDSDLPWYRR